MRHAKQPNKAGTLRQYAVMVFGFITLVAFFGTPSASAGGPRFISGAGLWVSPGQAEGWQTSRLLYYTDPGSLSTSVSHAQADALVAAAAAVWNVPTSSIALAQGGQLAEHVSSENSYFDGTNVIFPPDVEPSNEGVIPVAILYDTDGSVTDLLLGSGASEPLGCRQNAVTQSVDDIQQDGKIHHALIVLNGRCVGSAPEDLTQMQYQLARAFGRVLGISWSQTNDNVFTAVSTVTADQEAYWPLMHPLDVICGIYTYQCMINPFTLRPDDLSGLASVYPVLANSVPPGKQASDLDADWLLANSTFPTGQGMDWQNFTAHRYHAGAMEDFEIVSAITGSQYQQAVASPITGPASQNSGQTGPTYEGLFSMRVVPDGGLSNIYLTSEPINPLYSGEYALGPYARPPVTPSGSPQTVVGWSATSYPDIPIEFQSSAPDAASSCSPGSDGTEAAPAQLDPSGWQNGLLCGWGHNSWWSATIRAGRSWALEVTATDETGQASDGKAQPVIAVWNDATPIGTVPSVAVAPIPFNSMSFGMTQMQMSSSASDIPLRFAVGDAFGVGRPDFTYTARLLYADSVSPVSVGAGGGRITITGTGFRQGNNVTVNGVSAAVQSWTATEIVAVAPPFALSGAMVGTPVTISVTDPGTGGSTAISGALTYTQAPDLLQLVSAPTALETGVATGIPFAVRVLASDGVTPVAGENVSFAVTAGAASLTVCGTAASCTANSDSSGIVQTAIVANAVGSVTLTATELSGGATLQVVLIATVPARSVSFSTPAQYIAAGASGSWDLQLVAVQDGNPLAGVPVTWSVTSGLTLQTEAAETGVSGSAAVTVSSAASPAGSASTLTGCAWTTVCATWTVYGVDPSQWQIAVVAGAGQSVAEGATVGAVGLQITDAAGHPLLGAPVTVFQRVLGWEGPCPATGPCAAAPVLASSQTTLTSDMNGAVLFTPLQIAGIPQTVQIASVTGTQGFVSLSLVKTPTQP